MFPFIKQQLKGSNCYLYLAHTWYDVRKQALKLFVFGQKKYTVEIGYIYTTWFLLQIFISF